MSKRYPIQPDLFDDEAAQREVLPTPLASAKVDPPYSSIKRVRAQAAVKDLQPSVTPAPIAMREPERPYLSDVAVAARYDVSRPTIWRWAKLTPGFPQPVKVSSGTTRWRLEDLQRYDLERRTLHVCVAGPKGKGGAR